MPDGPRDLSRSGAASLEGCPRPSGLWASPGPAPHPHMARHRTLCIVAAQWRAARARRRCVGLRRRPQPPLLRVTRSRRPRDRVPHQRGARPERARSAEIDGRAGEGRRRAQPRHGPQRLLRARLADRLDPEGAHRSRRLLRRRVDMGDGRDDRGGSGGRATPASIVRSWLTSPGHRAILLDGRYKDLGVGIALGAPGPATGRCSQGTSARAGRRAVTHGGHDAPRWRTPTRSPSTSSTRWRSRGCAFAAASRRSPACRSCSTWWPQGLASVLRARCPATRSPATSTPSSGPPRRC